MDIQILTCCGICAPSEEAERQPLLPKYDGETAMQVTLHQKLHTYQMLRALSKGYMPSNDQTIVNLRTLLASELLNPPADDDELSDSGRAVLYYAKQTIDHFMQLLQHKNSDNQIQDFVWYLSHARMSVDMEDIFERAGRAQARANTAAAYSSLKTVGSLLLTNSDFRMFLSDLGTIGKEVFSDTAMKLSSVSEAVAKQIEPSAEEQETLQGERELNTTNSKSPGTDSSGSDDKPSTDTLGSEVAEMTKVVAKGATEVVGEAQQSLVDHLQGGEKDALLNRLRRTVANLRQRTDYSDSVSTLSLLLKRYATAYSHVVEDSLQAVNEDVSVNKETDKALRNFWSLIKSFGEAEQWGELERRFKMVYEHGRSDPEFDELVRQIGNAVQELLADPTFFEHAEERFQTLRSQSKQLATRSALRDDIDALLAQLQATLQSVIRDADVSRLLTTASKFLKLVSPKNHYVNTDLITDCINVFAPMIVQGIQYVPIPRLEVSTPDVDLLLENLILEPGRTVNGSSFLPYKLRVETKNDLEIRKTRLNRTASAVQSIVTIKLDGLSIAAKDVGFWLRVHSGLLRFSDEGIASFSLDERGIDVHIEVEIGKEKLEKILTLRSVRVIIHQLDYTLRKSKFALGAWLMKPFVLPLMKKTLELQIATAVSDSLQAANRELLFARERLRATRVADPDSLWTFIKAVGARLVPEDDPDLEVRVGVTQPGKGVFKGVYAPGSLIKLWNEEAVRAKDRIREQSSDGWRNEVFDVQTVPSMGNVPGVLG